MKKQLFYNCVIGKEESLEGYIPAGRLSIERAFGVYHRGYISRLTEALGDTYESVWKVLGDKIFFDVCEKFIALNESTSYNLSDYSVKFIDFLISQSASYEFPFLSDLAHLNWLHKEVFHRRQEVGLQGPEIMTLLEQDTGRASTVDAFELMKSDFRLFDIWKALNEDAPPPEEFLGKQYLVLYKMNQQVFVKNLTEKQFQAFENIRLGMPLMEAIDHLEEYELTELFHFVAKQALLKSF